MGKVKAVTLLNSSGEPLAKLSWKKAVIMLMTDKAYAACDENQYIEIKTTRESYMLPSVIALYRYVKMPVLTAQPTKKNIMRRDCFQCQYCGIRLAEEDQTIDHILPRAKGGRHEWKNVVAACRKCNTKKADKLLEHSGLRLRSTPYVPTRSELMRG